MFSRYNYEDGGGANMLLFSVSSSSDTTPLLCNSTQDRMFETMSVEIEQLLAKVRTM